MGAFARDMGGRERGSEGALVYVCLRLFFFHDVLEMQINTCSVQVSRWDGKKEVKIFGKTHLQECVSCT